MRIPLAPVLLALSLANSAQAAEPHAHGTGAGDAQAPGNAVVLELSPAVRGALVAEMAGLRQRVAELAAQLATGEWAQAADNARQVRNSYIMKQKLSAAQFEELARVLPAEFVALDARFHRHAEGLAHAALAHDADLALYYYGKLLEGCQVCHSQYATHSLTGFRRPAEEAHRH